VTTDQKIARLREDVADLRRRIRRIERRDQIFAHFIRALRRKLTARLSKS
jgi:archaellum biogenesis protein FlaJ (TadC family)